MALTEHDNAEEPSSEASPLLGDRNVQVTPDDDESSQGADTDNPGDSRDENHVPLAEEPSTQKALVVMSSIWFGSFLAALDSTIIATLSAPISASFNSLSLLSWLASSYFIANAALQPLSGRLTDILSRRTGLIFSNLFFAAGNLICGLATSEWVMIFGRVIAGMGGGGLNAISTFVGSDLIPLRRRGVWQGFGNICFGLGAGLGGVFGGWINDTWGWRKAFLIQVPFTIVSGILVFFTVKIPVKQSSKSALKRIDFLGAASLITTLVLLLVGLNSGGNVVPWNHPLIYTTLPLSFISLLLFIYIESNHASEPVIPVKLLLNRTVLAACLTNWFLSMCVFSLIFYGPIYFQVKGLSTTQAGARLIPQSLGTAIGSVSTGLIMRWTGKYYILNICIQLIFITAYALLSSFTLVTPAWEAVLAFFMSGIGYSGMLTTTLLAFVSAVDHKEQAVITSASYAFRSTGSAIGITVASAVFQNILKIRLWSEFGDREGAADVIGRLRDSLDAIKTLSVEWRVEVREVYMEALRGVFLTTLGIAIVGGLIYQSLHTITDPSYQPLNNARMLGVPFHALFTSLAFYHLSLLVFLLGAQLYQSFLANISAQHALSKSQFRILMASIWPMYSKMQMIASVLLALTYPGDGGRLALSRGSTSVQGLIYESDRSTVMLPLTMMVLVSAANALFVIPKTVSTMWKLHVETLREAKARGNTESFQAQEDTIKSESARDGKAAQKEESKSPHLKALTNKFLAFHGGSYLGNLATLGATVYYAMVIAGRYLE